MGEREAIERSDEPVTVDRLKSDLRTLGLEPGDAVLVHCSLSALGWVSGGAPAVVDSLREVLTEAGTLAMPTHSTQLSDPARWENPPVPDPWIERIRETAPPYRKEVTPTRMMGAVAECFRTYPGVLRSDHPTHSVAAWGAAAERVVSGHALDRPHGENSPLATLCDLDSDVLRLGVTANTSLHLAENRAANARYGENGAPVLVDGEREWPMFEEIESEGDFRALETDFERERPGAVRRGPAGEAEATLCRMRPLVEFGREWFEENRG
ncbi:aminoglycoside N(3)-acetyltransferase [Natronorarus salvus]|uniref:aminoglycoside N(3)-acetyltransferase n=1 Tax=Natronorarus salvus TaxID=3117733 RepID=UPI002F2694C2